MDGGRLQFAKLGEELLNVGVGDTEVEVGDYELGWAATGRDATGPPGAATTTAA